MSEKKSKLGAAGIIRLVLICIFATVFVVSAVMLISTLAHYRAASALYGQVQDDFHEAINKTTGEPGQNTVTDIWTRGPGLLEVPDVTTLPQPDVTTPPDAPESSMPPADTTTADTTPPAPVYSERFLNACEFIRQLKATNDDVVGYIYIEFPNDTSKDISYPLVQGEDDEYYIDHAYDNSELRAGAIFLDYRCQEQLERNLGTLVHGHNMNNGSMFHNLKYFKQQEYFNSAKITIYTLRGIYSYEVFSVYNTESNSDYSRIFFTSSDSVVDYLNERQHKSFFSKGLSFYNTDRFLTLSTCLNTSASGRLAVHAVLVGVSQ